MRYLCNLHTIYPIENTHNLLNILMMSSTMVETCAPIVLFKVGSVVDASFPFSSSCFYALLNGIINVGFCCGAAAFVCRYLQIGRTSVHRK